MTWTVYDVYTAITEEVDPILKWSERLPYCGCADKALKSDGIEPFPSYTLSAYMTGLWQLN